MKRRFFLLAAPAIVAAPSLMKVSALAMPQAEMVRRVSNPIRYGAGLYSGYDGYAITPNDWNAASKAAMLARADGLIAYLQMNAKPWVEVATVNLDCA